MAYNLQANDLVEMTVVITNAEQTALMKTHWFVVNIVFGNPTDQQFANYFDPINAAMLKGMIGVDSKYYGTGIQVLSGARKALVNSVTAAILGTGTGLTLPRQTAGVVSFRTALAGRSQRGRVYVPFPCSQFLAAGGVPTAGYIASLNVVGSTYAQSQTFVSGVDSAKLLPIILHKRLNTTTLITQGLSLQTRFATQRRRGSYGKANVPPF